MVLRRCSTIYVKVLCIASTILKGANFIHINTVIIMSVEKR